MNPLEFSQSRGVQTLFMGLFPYEFTGFRNEVMGAKQSAMLCTGLNLVSPTYDICGPDVREFMESICVNSFKNLKPGRIRHAVLCNEKGQILTDGVVACLEENRVRCYWLAPVIQYYVSKNTEYDIQGQDVTGTEFFYQISGPKSLEILEKAFDCDLHDIKFAHHRIQKVKDYEVRILRLGMSGNLAYEIHGDLANMNDVFDTICAAGEPLGMTKLGVLGYDLSHTEAGFPNINIHYPLPWYETEGLKDFMAEHPELGAANFNRILNGSVGEVLEVRFVNPYETGWGNLVKFDHEFPGKEALAKIAEEKHRTVVTLEWDADDVGKIYAAQFKGREESLNVESIDRSPVDFYMTNEYRADRVFAGEKEIGISTGRTNSYWYKKMISLAFIDPDYAEEGTELTICWGTPGCKQYPVHAKVARYPYNAEFGRNQEIDVNK